MKNVFFFCSMLLMLVSCATKYGESGKQFSTTNIHLIVEGTDAERVLQLMNGSPHERLFLDGRETWIWVYSNNDKTKSFTVSLYKNKVEETFFYIE